MCEFASKKGHQIAKSHFFGLIVPSVSITMYYSIKIWSTVSQLVTVYLEHMGADAYMTIQAAMSFISTTFHMVGFEWLLSVLICEAR